ncbi:ComF family protein [Chamaesiphon sp. VAR_69_metabat_338]|uniref:ComF family protein n=1 Tax=Chamaesiphon sp. VAR_69_metabat_338 TaxID=2964704 RepID=UPI00286D8D49|nr:ComF family protein [Chamaesiphon sp. VAR_69_metabat_338]
MSNPWHRSIGNITTALKNRTLNLFLKSNCPLCDRAAALVFCQYCQRQIQECQLTKPAQYWQGDLPLFAWGKYEGAIKRSIGKLKYDGHRSIGDFYGEALAAGWQTFAPVVPTKLIVLPVPLHPDKLASRGFNQAELIARKFCQMTGAKLDLSLHRTRSTVAQFGLSKSARQENVEGAFALVNSSLKPGDTVSIVDDIYTTGSTVRAIASVLRSQQINVCGVAVVAITERDN